MKKNQKALIRQTTIFGRLNAGETVNVKALAEEFGVGVRTIQKDMNERLSTTYDIVDLGHGDYRFAEGYRLYGGDDEEEKIAISLMKSLQRSAIPTMNEYIDTAFPAATRYEEMFLFDLDFEPIEDMGIFKVILQAIKWKVGMEFHYTKKDGSSKEVTAHPYRIANFRNYWYLIAYDLAAEKLKAYYLQSIARLHTLYENFIADARIEQKLEQMCSQIDSAWYGDNVYYTKLRLTADARFYLERHLPYTMEVVEADSESVIVTFRYSDESEVFSIVKKWLPDIRIIDNPELARKLEDVLRNYLHV